MASTGRTRNSRCPDTVLWREDALADAFAAVGWTDVEVRDSSSPHAAEAWITVTARNGND
jgi:hypothetical protein